MLIKYSFPIKAQAILQLYTLFTYVVGVKYMKVCLAISLGPAWVSLTLPGLQCACVCTPTCLWLLTVNPKFIQDLRLQRIVLLQIWVFPFMHLQLFHYSLSKLCYWMAFQEVVVQLTRWTDTALCKNIKLRLLECRPLDLLERVSCRSFLCTLVLS